MKNTHIKRNEKRMKVSGGEFVRITIRFEKWQFFQTKIRSLFIQFRFIFPSFTAPAFYSVSLFYSFSFKVSSVFGFYLISSEPIALISVHVLIFIKIRRFASISHNNMSRIEFEHNNEKAVFVVVVFVFFFPCLMASVTGMCNIRVPLSIMCGVWMRRALYLSWVGIQFGSIYVQFVVNHLKLE